jgi:hypothetical protein
MTHAISVKLTEQGHRWECGCGAKGSAHSEHQLAMEMGIQHTWIMAGENEHER